MNFLLILGVFFSIFTPCAANKFCFEFIRGREIRALFDCMAGWKQYLLEQKAANLEATLSNSIASLCRDNSLYTTRQCVSEMAGNRKNTCSDVLLMWRHIFDPIDFICRNLKEYEHSQECRGKIRGGVKQCVNVVKKLEKIKRGNRNRDINCGFLLSYRKCLRDIKSTCTQKTTNILANVIELHLRHIGAFYQCEDEICGMTGAARGTGFAYPPGAPELTPGCWCDMHSLKFEFLE